MALPSVLKGIGSDFRSTPEFLHPWLFTRDGRIPNTQVQIEHDGDPPEEKGRSGIIRNYDTRSVVHPVMIPLPGGDDLPHETEPEDKTPAELASDFGLTDEEFQVLHERWQEEQTKEVDRRLAEIEAEAYARGRKDERREREEEIELLTEEFRSGLQNLEKAWTEFFDKADPLLLQTAVDISRKIVQSPLPDSVYKHVKEAVTDAISAIAGAGSTDITLHPTEYLYLKESGLLSELNDTYGQLNWHSDPEIDRGDWKVETSTAAIHHITEDLLADIEERLGLDPPVDS